MAALAVLAGACSTTSEADSIEISALEVEANDTSPLSAWLHFETGAEVGATVVLASDDHTVEVPPQPAAEVHDVPLLGMHPATTYEVTVTVDGGDGPVQATTELTTGALPDVIPPFTVETQPDRVQPGLTMMNLVTLGILNDNPAAADLGLQTAPAEGFELPDEEGWIIALDETGEVVWYYEAPQTIDDIVLTDAGTLLLTYGHTELREIDLMGTTLREWRSGFARDQPLDGHGRPRVGEDAIDVDIDVIHHEIAELPNGNLITLGAELLTVDFGTPPCDDHPQGDSATFQLVADVVVEFEPDTGAVVHRWPLSDYLDPVETPGWGLCMPLLPFSWYVDAPDAGDWTHANAVVVDTEHNELLVSIRHLDMILALRATDDESGPAGEALWSTGPYGTASLAAGSRWTSGQHAPEVEADGGIVVFDNGNRRGDGPPSSRAVRYAVDRSGAIPELDEVWSWGGPGPDGAGFAPFVGDADVQPNGNVLVTFGGRLGFPWVQEVVPAGADDAEVVWDFRIDDARIGWVVYRADKIPSLYPG